MRRTYAHLMLPAWLIALVFLAGVALAADPAASAAAKMPPNASSQGGQPKSLPLTLIIDDGAPCINVYWWFTASARQGPANRSTQFRKPHQWPAKEV